MSSLTLQAIIVTTALGAALTCGAGTAHAQLRAELYAQGFSAPLGFVQDPIDPNVQYVVEQRGRIRVVYAGELLPTDFLNLTGTVSTTGSERGLLGLAFAPDYAESRRFYVNFTRQPDGHTVVARFKRSEADPLVADPATRFDLRWGGPGGQRFIEQPFANHNGGNLQFGPLDGYLYIGLGDGGSAGDPLNNAQNPNTLLGKMLRIDVNVPDEDQEGYVVPPDNPLIGFSLPEIWAFGLRNPWRYTFDAPALGGTGAMIMGDVGQNLWEEINYEPSLRGGRNYGWSVYEGLHDFRPDRVLAYEPATFPIWEYPHPTGISITGGYVYRGVVLPPGYQGRYFYADLNGRSWSIGLFIDPGTGEASVLDEIEHTAELSGMGNISSFGQDFYGELYIVSYNTGRIFRIAPVQADPCANGIIKRCESQ